MSRMQRKGYPIHKVDIDRQKSLEKRFRIRQIPTFVAIRDGREIERIVGLASEGRLKDLARRVSRRSPATAAPSIPSAGRSGGLESKTREQKPSFANSLVQKTKEVLTPRIKLPLFGRSKTVSDTRSNQAPIVRAKYDDATDRRVSARTAHGVTLDYCTRIRVIDDTGINFGSGTLVDSRPGRTLILTCGHIFRELSDRSTIEVDVFSRGESKKYAGQIVQYDLDADVGLIAIESGNALPTCRIAADTTHVVKGSPVVSLGCSSGRVPTRQQLRVTALNRYFGPDTIECTGVPVRGRSGGGLFDVNGEVIGVCDFADHKDQRGLYCGSKAIREFLDQCGLSALYRRGNPNLPHRIEVPKLRDDFGPNTARIDDAATIRPNFEMRPAVPLADTSKPPQFLSAADLNTASVGAFLAEAERSDSIPAALAQAGEAEVVCIIRPLGDARSASRIVIINRASNKFIADLTGEINKQVRPTMASFRRHARPSLPATIEQPSVPDLLNRAALYKKRAARRTSGSSDRPVAVTADYSRP